MGQTSKYVTTNANYCKTIPKKNNFYSALCSQISQTFFQCSWFMMHVWEAISKTRASCFIGVSKHSKTIKALGLRPRAFISFLVFGNPDETIALVFEILHQGQHVKNRNWQRQLDCCRNQIEEQPIVRAEFEPGRPPTNPASLTCRHHKEVNDVSRVWFLLRSTRV